MRQITFACQPSFEKYARSSRREQFLNSMEAVVPWSELEALIEPHYPKAGKGRQPVGLGIVLRIYFLQHWFSKASLARFGALMVLHEGAETDDGDDALASDRLTRGLHAKAYIAENGWDTTLYLGSANATNASLVAGSNVEILAELTGKRSRIGGIDSFLGDHGMQEYLIEFEPPEEPPPLSAEEQAEKIIDAARADLMLAGIRLSCSPASADAWDLSIFAKRNIKLKQIESIRIWPISLPKERAVDGVPLATMAEVLIPRCAIASITGFVAFELTTVLCSHAVCFVLNLHCASCSMVMRAGSAKSRRNSAAFARRSMAWMIRVPHRLSKCATSLRRICGRSSRALNA